MQNLDDKIKRITIKEFVDFGFLQEANRQFFHPLGLALCLHVDNEDPEAIEAMCSVWDSRDDPEGFVFGDEPKKAQERIDKMLRVVSLQGMKVWQRAARTGFVIQPIHTIEIAEA